jgi:hypothetical protein
MKFFMKEKTIMNKIIRYIRIYLILGLPFVVTFMIWSSANPHIGNITGFTFKQLIPILFIVNLICWFITLIIFLVSLIVLPSVREKTICYLANIKERDEREEYITGKAARFAYISSLSLLIFLLFLSIFSVEMRFFPEKPLGKNATLHIGLSISLLENKSVPASTTANVSQHKTMLDTTHYSLSKTAVLLILLSWQLIAFNVAARKEQVN